MADPHGHGPSSHHAVEEDVLRTPGWLPLLGLGLLMAGALAVYLWISPGVMNPPTDGGDAGAAPAANPAPANPAPAPSGGPGGAH